MVLNKFGSKFKVDSSITILIEFLLFLILMYPNNHKIIKIPLIVILLVCCVVLFLNKKIRVSKQVLFWFLIYFFANILFLLIGINNNFEVFYQLTPLKLLWPVLYLLIVVFVSSIKTNSLKFDNIMYMTGIIIPVMILFTYTFDGIHNTVSIFFPYTRHEYAGFMDYYSSSITSLFFLGSYSITRVLVSESRKSQRFIIPVVLIILVSLIIGRRALLITSFLTPVIFILVQMYAKKINFKNRVFIKKKHLFFSLLTVFFIAIFLYTLPLFTGSNLRIFEILNGNEVFQNNERWLQLESLIKGWIEKPVFGSGFGSNAEIVRSDIYLGLYELSYVALLFQTGIVGFIIYLGLYTWLIYKMAYVYKSTGNVEVLSFCLGTVSIFIANFSNPYIDSFDGLFFIFFALAIINIFEISKEVSYASGDIDGNL